MLRVHSRLPILLRTMFRNSSSITESEIQIPKANYIGQPPESLKVQFEELGLKTTVEKRVWGNVYVHGASKFSEIPDEEIGKNAKNILDDHYYIDFGTVCKENFSNNDGTAKWLVGFDKHKVESELVKKKDLKWPNNQKIYLNSGFYSK